MEKQPKIYCGSGKKKSDTWLQASINLDKIKEHIQEYKGSRFIKVNINVKAEPPDLQSGSFSHSEILPYGSGGTRTHNFQVKSPLLYH